MYKVVRGHLPTLRFCFGLKWWAVPTLLALARSLNHTSIQQRPLESQDNIQPEDRDLIMQLSPLYLEQIQAAKQEDRQEIALRMLRENIPLETIARITELSIERLQVLRSQLENT